MIGNIVDAAGQPLQVGDEVMALYPYGKNDLMKAVISKISKSNQIYVKFGRGNRETRKISNHIVKICCNER